MRTVHHERYDAVMDLRGRTGWGARRIARELELSVSTVNNWVMGKRSPYTVEEMYAAYRALPLPKTKRCGTCKKTLPRERFTVLTAPKTGTRYLQSQCRLCKQYDEEARRQSMGRERYNRRRRQQYHRRRRKLRRLTHRRVDPAKFLEVIAMISYEDLPPSDKRRVVAARAGSRITFHVGDRILTRGGAPGLMEMLYPS
jgi:transcriptional regulator with XRE-family HTH domain